MSALRNWRRHCVPRSVRPHTVRSEDSASVQPLTSIDRWLQAKALRPRLVAEVDDSALLKVFGEHGAGVFAAPSVIERDICEQYGVEVVGRTDEVRERFYVISVERRIKHLGVALITERARNLFAAAGKHTRSGSPRGRRARRRSSEEV